MNILESFIICNFQRNATRFLYRNVNKFSFLIDGNTLDRCIRKIAVTHWITLRIECSERQLKLAVFQGVVSVGHADVWWPIFFKSKIQKFEFLIPCVYTLFTQCLQPTNNHANIDAVILNLRWCTHTIIVSASIWWEIYSSWIKGGSGNTAKSDFFDLCNCNTKYV